MLPPFRTTVSLSRGKARRVDSVKLKQVTNPPKQVQESGQPFTGWPADRRITNIQKTTSRCPLFDVFIVLGKGAPYFISTKKKMLSFLVAGTKVPLSYKQLFPLVKKAHANAETVSRSFKHPENKPFKMRRIAHR